MEDRELAAVIDMGSSTTAMALGELLPRGRVNITAWAATPSAGIAKSRIVDMKQAQYTIATVVKKLSDIAEWEIETAQAVVSGAHVSTRRALAKCALPGRIVREENLDDLSENARTNAGTPDGRVQLHREEVGWRLDGVGEVENPLGMEGSSLVLETLYVEADAARFHDMQNAAAAAHLELAEPSSAGVCAAMGCSSARERNEGTLFIDLGAGTANWTVFSKGSIAATGALGVGSDHVTNDISQAFACSRPCAEELKKCANAVLSRDASRRIPLPSAFSARDGATISRRSLDTVVNARLSETFSIIRQMTESQGVGHLVHGVVLTGGGAMQNGIAELAGSLFGCPASIGRISPDVTFSDDCRAMIAVPEAQLATIAGAFLLLSQNADVREDDDAGAASPLARFKNFLGKVFN